MQRLWLRIVAHLAPEPVVLLIEEGDVLVRKGKVPPSLLADIREVAADAEIKTGMVAGERGGEHARLRFCGPLTASQKQRLRNTWLA